MTATNDYDIGNLALQILGESTRITSLAQSVKAARAVNNCYDDLRQSELRAHPWKFAIARRTLVAATTTPAFGRSNQFAVPSDQLRLLPKYEEDNWWTRDWLIESGYIVSDEDDAASIITDVRVASTANGTLATAFADGQTVDGVVLATGDRILLKNQTTASENGVYVVTATTPTRATDFDETSEVRTGATVQATAGTVGAGLYFTLTTDNPITVGTTSQTWGAGRSAVPAVLHTRWIVDKTDVSTWDPLFKICMAAKIAYQICEEITQSNVKQTLASARYKDAMKEARRMNAIEKPPRRSTPSRWLTVREGGGRDYTRVNINR